MLSTEPKDMKPTYKKNKQLFFYIPVRNMVIKSGKTIILTVASKVKQEQA